MSLVDTDIFIDYLRGFLPARSFFSENSDFIEISAYSCLELIYGCGNKKETAILERFISAFPVIESGPEVTRLARDILLKRYLTDGIEVVDSLIAATAIVGGKELITRNVKHYRNIEGLKLVKPY